MKTTMIADPPQKTIEKRKTFYLILSHTSIHALRTQEKKRSKMLYFLKRQTREGRRSWEIIFWNNEIACVMFVCNSASRRRAP